MKTFFTSKTIWTFLILFFVAIMNVTGITNLPLSPDASWLTIVLSVIVIILRLLTKEPINWDDTDSRNNLRTFVLFLFIPMILAIALPSTSSAQVLIVQDSITYQDSTLTINTGAFDEFYLELYNNGSDSTVTVYVYSVNTEGYAVLTGIVDMAGSSTATIVTSTALTSNLRKRYWVPGGHNQLKILFSPGEGIKTRVDVWLNAFKRLQF